MDIMKATNVYRIDEKNVGDMYSAPNRYFDFGDNEKDIWQLDPRWEPEDKHVIIGGGGLIGQMRALTPMCYLLKDKGYKLYGWGVGDHSFVCMDEQSMYMPNLDVTYPSFIRTWDLIGIRDYYEELYGHLSNYHWVPCVSCMDEAFDKEYEIKHEYVYYNHQELPFQLVAGMKIKTPENLEDKKEIFMNNKEGSFDEVINFLGSGETVITNSYHGVYWATLLKRKVVCFPYSSKFWGFYHKPTYATPLDYVDELDKCIVYDEALDDCREATMDYYKILSERIGNE
tara:strand:- start:1619 stop:2473 length:855 start_codon:yes stop_codon:yes gene_type:complete